VKLPAFTADGLLPMGDYELTFDELRQSMLVVGYPGCDPHWDAAWRLMLVDNLVLLAKELWEVGIEEIFVDGSFVEDKLHPNDIDGYFVCYEWPRKAAELRQKLNLRNPHKIWTWEVRWPSRGQEKPQLPMWHVYRVELFPHFGQGAGIVDEYGHELEFPAAFRKRRGDFARKGIVRLKKS